MEENEDHWNDDDIRLLLQIYDDNKEKFRDSTIKKKDLWKQIALLIGKTDVSCDRKFRNLKGTYIKLLRRKHKTGAASIKWPYFNLMHDILKGDVNINPVGYLKRVTSITSVNSSYVDKDTSMLINTSTEETFRASAPDYEGGTPEIKRRKLDRYRQLAEEIKERQRRMEVKIDKLNEILMKSNEIQETRNKLLQRYLEHKKK
ncbi:hypothetical protein ILUMI_12024 [Ignelater luminosus]|uniref:Myb/SANT-like DNA-binding domain-containing protein n=1 Tax=Ignelater luminosus TaxID=2038154 RepID=A0A8K0G9Y2_IGNLU|nr:hypothetical protein ILUMI_12024 [Ignelater luminosus]